MFDTLTLTAVLGMGSYQGEETPEPYFKLQAGTENVYVWGGYEDLKSRMLGQPIGDTEVYSLGLGARKSFDQFFAYAEIGYGHIIEGARSTIQQEVVYTELVGRHERPFRPIPVYPTGDYDQDSYETTWELSGGPIGEIGVGWQANDYLSYTLSYRMLYADEHIELYDQEQRDNGGGYWQETRSKDLSSWRVAVRWSF